MQPCKSLDVLVVLQWLVAKLKTQLLIKLYRALHVCDVDQSHDRLKSYFCRTSRRIHDAPRLSLHSAALRRTASVVRHRRHVADGLYVEPGGSQCTDRGLAS